MARGMVDERSLEALRRMRREDASRALTLAEFKTLVREQFFMLLLDQEAALAAIPKMLPQDVDARRTALRRHPRRAVGARGEISGETSDAAATASRSCSVWARERPANSGNSFRPQAKAS